MTTAIYPRPPRRPGPRMPRGEVVVEAPPELTRRRSAAAAQLITVVPMMGSVGSMAVLFTSGGNAGRMWISAGFFAVSAVAMLFGMAAGGGVRRADVDAQRRDYMRRLGQVRKQLRRAVDEQRLAATWQHPDPHVLWSLIGARRMWERRPDDDDFAEVRIGLGEQRAAVTVTVAQQKPVEDSEPLSVIALKRFRRGHDYVPALPRSVRLAAFQRVGVDGDRDKAVALVRAVLCQLAAFHAPDDLRIALVVADGRRADWDWLKWLPHVQQPEAADGSGTARLVFESLIDFEDAVPEDLSGRVGSGGTSVPQIVVVIDGGDAPTTAKLRRSEYAGVTLLDLSGVTRRGAGRDILLSVAADGALSHLDGKRVGDLGIADALSETEADALARQIAPWRPEPRAATRSSAPRSAELPDLLGIADIESFDPASTGRRSARARLRVPLGLAPDGAVVELDFKESAHQGMGPHGLLIGGTGSGKSELLRTIVMGLAATHSSDDLNFVLVDFKGGATFAPFAGLPHISAVVTNLSDELSLVDRMEAAVGGELVRRQELLRDAGNYASRFDYENARQRGVPLDPLPSLLIICDEFSELLTARPGFADLFVQIGRVGRSMGVHLLLASQRLDEGKLRGLESLLSYRICLRTDTASDSRAVLRSTVAFELPKDAAGSGYLQPDPATLLRFRGAMVSGEYQRRQAGVGAVAVAAAGRQVVRFVLSSPPVSAQPAPTPAPAPVPPPAAALPTGESDEGTLLEIFVDRLRGHGRPAHKVWLEPLGVPPTLDELLPRLKPDPERGLQPVGAAPGTLTVPVGIVDQPAEQRCDPLVLQLGGTGAGGNVVVVGGTRSGKSTLLRTLICALALTHTPAEVQFFCLDFSGGALRGLDGLPHVSGVAGRRDTDAVRRTIAEIGAILEAREEAFARHGVESMEVWRQRRASGAITDDSFGDVFLVIDGWATVREDFEAQEGVITGLAARGLNFGVHLVIAAARWAEVRPALRALGRGAAGAPRPPRHPAGAPAR